MLGSASRFNEAVGNSPRKTLHLVFDSRAACASMRPREFPAEDSKVPIVWGKVDAWLQ